MKIFIMAQGKGSRWTRNSPVDVPKQLIPIGDTTIIGRTIKQLGREHEIVVVAPSEFVIQVPEWCKVVTLDEPTGALLRGIYFTGNLWESDRNVILLGDVIFSNTAIDLILNEKLSFAMYGRIGTNLVAGKEASELFKTKMATFLKFFFT